MDGIAMFGGIGVKENTHTPPPPGKVMRLKI